MKLAAVRSIGTARSWRCEQDAEDFEQEIVDQFALALDLLADGDFRHRPIYQEVPIVQAQTRRPRSMPEGSIRTRRES
jgi:hypothetical protein